MKNGFKSKILSGLVWTFAERICAQLVSFIISIILARLLLPEEYGVITLVLVFINIANVFVTDGFGQSLIQKNDADKKDFSTIFTISIVLSIILYIFLFFSSTYIAKIYDIPLLSPIIKVLSLKIPISALSTMQHAYVSKNMLFKKFFYSTLFGTLISGCIGIFMAYLGFGVWALVAQYLLNTCIDTLVLFFTIPWKPSFSFPTKNTKPLIKYAWRLTAMGLINTGYSELRNIMIGKKYTTSELAYYNRGDQFPSLVIKNVNTSIGNVMFPVFSKINDNIEELKRIGRKTMKMTTFIIFPLLIFLFMMAKPIVNVVLTDKWLLCVPFLQVNCLFWMTQPLQTTNLQIIKATGRSDLCLKLEILKKIIGIFLLITSIPFGVMAVAISSVFTSWLSMFINMIPNKSLIKYSVFEQIKDLFPEIVLSLITGLGIYLINFLPCINLIKIFLGFIGGAIIYFSVAYYFKMEALLSIINFIKNIRRKNGKSIN